MRRNIMRKAVAILGVTGALTFGGAGIAHAPTYDSPVPNTTTPLAQSEAEDDGDNTGLWGLAGLLGLVGLLGLKRRDDRTVAAAPGQAGYGHTPRVSQRHAQSARRQPGGGPTLASALRRWWRLTRGSYGRPTGPRNDPV